MKTFDGLSIPLGSCAKTVAEFIRETNMRLKSICFGIMMLLPLMPMSAAANDNEVLIEAFFKEHVSNWLMEPVLVSAIRSQNAVNSDITQAQIDAKDLQWRAEVDTDTRPLVNSVLMSEAAKFLRARVDEAQDTITEVFVTDAHGLNVAMSVATSDYWQGDEEKFTETFSKGNGAMHMSNLAVDASTGLYQVQVSFTLTDPDSNEPIGSITVGLIADAIL
jgi:hypothetical protein